MLAVVYCPLLTVCPSVFLCMLNCSTFVAYYICCSFKVRRRWRTAHNFPAKSSSAGNNLRQHETTRVDERYSRSGGTIRQPSKARTTISDSCCRIYSGYCGISGSIHLRVRYSSAKRIAVCLSSSFCNSLIIIIIISIFVKRHKVVTSDALAAVGCVC